MFENITLPKNSPFGVIHYTLYPDNKDKLLLLSDNVAEMWGFSKVDIENNSQIVWDAIDKKYVQKVYDKVYHSRDTLQPYSSEYLYNKPNGKSIWIQEVGFPVRQEDGSTVFHITLQDVSYLKYSENESYKLNNRFSTLLDVIKDGVIIINKNHNIISFNKAAESMFKYRSHEIVGKSINSLIPQDVHDKHKMHIDSFKNSLVVSQDMRNFRKINAVDSESNLFPVAISIGKSNYDNDIVFIAVVKPLNNSKYLLSENINNYLIEEIADSLISADKLNNYFRDNNLLDKANEANNIVQKLNNLLNMIEDHSNSFNDD